MQAPVVVQQQQEPAEGYNPFAAAGASMNVTGASSFVPKGALAVTEEEFPDFDAIDTSKKKKKAVPKGPTPEQLREQKEKEVANLPTKGKPSSFFFVAPNMDPALRLANTAQQTFMFEHYPLYG